MLAANIYPQINLNSNSIYVLGVIHFQSDSSILNLDGRNNKFYFDKIIIEVPTGSYHINDLSKYLQNKVKEIDENKFVTIKANRNTIKSELKCTKMIYFTTSNTSGDLLGFKPKILSANITYTSDDPGNFFKVNAICIQCNLISRSYKNSDQIHIIHEFFPKAVSGENIVEADLPYNSRTISSITVQILDQCGELKNFR